MNQEDEAAEVVFRILDEARAAAVGNDKFAAAKGRFVRDVYMPVANWMDAEVTRLVDGKRTSRLQEDEREMLTKLVEISATGLGMALAHCASRCFRPGSPEYVPKLIEAMFVEEFNRQFRLSMQNKGKLYGKTT